MADTFSAWPFVALWHLVVICYAINLMVEQLKTRLKRHENAASYFRLESVSKKILIWLHGLFSDWKLRWEKCLLGDWVEYVLKKR